MPPVGRKSRTGGVWHSHWQTCHSRPTAFCRKNDTQSEGTHNTLRYSYAYGTHYPSPPPPSLPYHGVCRSVVVSRPSGANSAVLDLMLPRQGTKGHRNVPSSYALNYRVAVLLLTSPLTYLNRLQPTGHVMHQQFNIQQPYVLPTLYLCVLYLSENKQRLVPLTA